MELSGFFHKFIPLFSSLGIFSALGAGVLLASAFTAAPAMFLLYELLDVFPIWQVCFAGGLGAMAGDYIILRVFKDRLWQEWKPWLKSLVGPKLEKAAESRHWKWVLPLLGAIVIASPFLTKLGSVF